jgi:hypothetical protein
MGFIKPKMILPGLLALFVLCFSCGRSNKDKQLVTDRIQYDVDIKSPDPEFDWWVQNIEGSSREAFIRQIIDAAYSGKLRVYNYFNEPLTAEEVKMIGNRSDTFTFQREYPPYDFYDTVIRQRLEMKDITRIRFLEEWYMDEKTLEFDKKIVGIAPIIRKYDPNGELRGYMPLFWVYLDERVPGNK